MQVNSSSTIRKVRNHLKHDGVIAYATESCFGIGCNPWSYKAVAKILKIKQRSSTKGLIVVAGSLKQVSNVVAPRVDLNNAAINKFWPGFYSIIMEKNKHLPANLTGSHKKIAIRFSNYPYLSNLCKSIDSPLVSTSANLSGHRSIKVYKDCVKQFGRDLMVIPGIIEHRRKPSTVIDWPSLKVLRK